MSDAVPVAKPIILIIEDHERVRAELHDLVNTHFARCCFLEAKNRDEALSLAAERPPDVVLIDIGWPQRADLETTRQIKAIAPHALVALLALYEELPYQAEATAAGVDAFVPRPQIASELIKLLAKLPSIATRPVSVKTSEVLQVTEDPPGLNEPQGE